MNHLLPHGHFTGWLPPRPDRKPKLTLEDHSLIKGVPIKTATDLSPKMPSIWDQGQIGSCTAHGSLRAFMAVFMEILLKEYASKVFMPSRLAQYYWTRLSEGTQDQDAGASVADAIETLRRCGVAPESDWAYDVDKFAVAPPDNVTKEALSLESAGDFGVDNTDPDQIRAALSADRCVVFGCSVFPEIEQLTDANPVLPMPRGGFLGLFAERSIGGHCMAITGHDDSTRLYQVDNSWGPGYARKGRLYMPYEYIHSADLTSDCHVVDQVKQAA